MVVVPGSLARRTSWISEIEPPWTSRCHAYTGTERCGVWAADSSMLDRLSQRPPMAVIKNLAYGLSTLPVWAIPIANKITKKNLRIEDMTIIDSILI